MLADALAEREAFERGFRRSRRGNLWRQHDGKTLTVYRRPDGLFGYAIAGDGGPAYSRAGYADEDTAVGELWYRIGGGL